MKNFETILVIIIGLRICNQKPEDPNKKSSHYVRMQMEEITQEQLFTKSHKNETNENLITFLVENVRELFLDIDNSTMKVTSEGANNFRGLLEIFKTTTESITNNQNLSIKIEELKSNEVALIFLLNRSNYDSAVLSKSYNPDEVLSSLKNIKAKTERNRAKNYLQSVPSLVTNISTTKTDTDAFIISCINCDNVMIEECNDPKYKLVPSKNCEHTDDVCYSQHTPFGIIDRGCFNINHNLTQFVCACNLCNYMSISEMPYIFSNKRYWIENVIELSRAKRFRDSSSNDLSCLKCEVNVTAKTGDRVGDAHCLEGNIAMLPTEICETDEICVIKAIRSEGYVWRGCSDEQFYNYWFTMCDSDLCNYDSIVSVYNTI